jgi:hypothetical protein
MPETDTPAALRKEQIAIWEAYGPYPQDAFIERLLAAIERAERERELDLVALEAAEKEVDTLQARVAALSDVVQEMIEKREGLAYESELLERARALLAPPASQRPA